jgi:hypothetical protein
MFVIRTKYKTNANGTGQIVAKGEGKQRTATYDPARSSAYNHGAAAGVLALALGLEWHPGIEHDSSDDGTQHGFAWTPPVLIDLTRKAIA